jgi:hypothetical protein
MATLDTQTGRLFDLLGDIAQFAGAGTHGGHVMARIPPNFAAKSTPQAPSSEKLEEDGGRPVPCGRGTYN